MRINLFREGGKCFCAGGKSFYGGGKCFCEGVKGFPAATILFPISK